MRKGACAAAATSLNARRAAAAAGPSGLPLAQRSSSQPRRKRRRRSCAFLARSAPRLDSLARVSFLKVCLHLGEKIQRGDRCILGGWARSVPGRERLDLAPAISLSSALDPSAYLLRLILLEKCLGNYWEEKHSNGRCESCHRWKLHRHFELQIETSFLMILHRQNLQP